MKTNSHPLVSLGLPVYNGADCMRDALDSLLAQTYTNVEIVICDNASTDRTAEISKEYAGKDRRIRYYRNEVNIGAIKNFWRVAELSTGEYIMWTGADDIRPPETVETCLAALIANNQAVMAHGPILIKVKGQKELIELANKMDLGHAAAAVRVEAFVNGMEHIAMEYGLYRKSAMRRAVYGNHYGQDFLLCLQMCLMGPIEYVRAPMIVYYEGEPVINADPVDSSILKLSFASLLKPIAAVRKAWIVLLRGIFYLLRLPGVSLKDRCAGALVYTKGFARRYRVRLAKEAVFFVFTPLSWLRILTYKLARPMAVRLGLIARLDP